MKMNEFHPFSHTVHTLQSAAMTLCMIWQWQDDSEECEYDHQRDDRQVGRPEGEEGERWLSVRI